MFTCALFLVQLLAFSVIAFKVVVNWNVIETSNDAARVEDEPNPLYCKENTWKLMQFVTFVYSIVAAFWAQVIVRGVWSATRRIPMRLPQ
jgi:hypothetical protein